MLQVNALAFSSTLCLSSPSSPCLCLSLSLSLSALRGIAIVGHSTSVFAQTLQRCCGWLRRGHCHRCRHSCPAAQLTCPDACWLSLPPARHFLTSRGCCCRCWCCCCCCFYCKVRDSFVCHCRKLNFKLFSHSSLCCSTRPRLPSPICGTGHLTDTEPWVDRRAAFFPLSLVVLTVCLSQYNRSFINFLSPTCAAIFFFCIFIGN